ncbi:MAG: hypothetical protein ACJASM_000985 [Salibacteraceae bacterium]|jgi:hypothetical protein
MFEMKNQPTFDSNAQEALNAIIHFTAEKPKVEQLISDAIKNPLSEIQNTLSMVNNHFYDFYSASIRDQQDRILGRIWTFKDITTQKKRIKELIKVPEKC